MRYEVFKLNKENENYKPITHSGAIHFIKIVKQGERVNDVSHYKLFLCSQSTNGLEEIETPIDSFKGVDNGYLHHIHTESFNGLIKYNGIIYITMYSYNESAGVQEFEFWKYDGSTFTKLKDALKSTGNPIYSNGCVYSTDFTLGKLSKVSKYNLELEKQSEVVDLHELMSSYITNIDADIDMADVMLEIDRYNRMYLYINANNGKMVLADGQVCKELLGYIDLNKLETDPYIFTKLIGLNEEVDFYSSFEDIIVSHKDYIGFTVGNGNNVCFTDSKRRSSICFYDIKNKTLDIKTDHEFNFIYKISKDTCTGLKIIKDKDKNTTIVDYIYRPFSGELVEFSNRTIADNLTEISIVPSKFENLYYCLELYGKTNKIITGILHEQTGYKCTATEVESNPYTTTLTYYDGGNFDGALYESSKADNKDQSLKLLTNASSKITSALLPEIKPIEKEEEYTGTNVMERLSLGALDTILKDIGSYEENRVEDVIQLENEFYIITYQKAKNKTPVYRCFKNSKAGFIELTYVKDCELEYSNRELKYHVYKKTDKQELIIVRFNPFVVKEIVPGNLDSDVLKDYVETAFGKEFSKQERLNLTDCKLVSNRYLVFYSDIYVYPTSDLNPTDTNIKYKGKVPHVYDVDYLFSNGNPDSIITPGNGVPIGYASQCEIDINNNIIFSYEIYEQKNIIISYNPLLLNQTILIGDIPVGKFKDLKVLANKIVYGISSVNTLGQQVDNFYMNKNLLFSNSTAELLSCDITSNKMYIGYKYETFESKTNTPIIKTKFIFFDLSSPEIINTVCDASNEFSQLVFCPKQLEYYGFSIKTNYFYKISLDGVINSIFSKDDLLNSINEIYTIDKIEMIGTYDDLTLNLYTDNKKFPYVIKYLSQENKLDTAQHDVCLDFTIDNVFVYYPVGTPIENVALRYPVITDNSGGDNNGNPPKELYGLDGILKGKPGDIIYFAGLYYEDNNMPVPSKPKLDGDCYSLLQRPITKWKIGDTYPNKELRWYKLNNNTLVCDRVIWTDISYKELFEQGYIRGKIVAIDGREFKIRALTGGSTVKEGTNRYYSGGLPLNNEWDLYIGNRGNFSYFPVPLADDLINTTAIQDYTSVHNTFWNWSKMHTICLEHCQTELPLNEAVTFRGFNSAMYWKAEESTGFNEHIGYRPVLIIDPLSDGDVTDNISPIQLTNIKQTDETFSWFVNIMQYNITNAKSQCYVFNAAGKVVKQGKVFDGTGQKIDILSLSTLAPGTYTWKIKTWADQIPETWSVPFTIKIINSIKAKISINLPNGTDYEKVWKLNTSASINTTVKLYLNEILLDDTLNDKEQHVFEPVDFKNGINVISMKLVKDNANILGSLFIYVLKNGADLSVCNNIKTGISEDMGEIPKSIYYNATLTQGSIDRVFASIDAGKNYYEIPYGKSADCTHFNPGQNLTFVVSHSSDAQIIAEDYSWE